MWSPVNVYALPTAQDTIHAKEALKQLEDRWDELMREIAAAREMADKISQQIIERKAWLAPVRKLPDEILSQIFVLHARMHWFAPLILGAVCRVWRGVVLATPRAWTYVNLDLINPNKLPFWIQRCGRAEIHVLSGLSAGANVARLPPDVFLTSLTLDRSVAICDALARPNPKLRTLQVRFRCIDNVPPAPSTSIIDVARFPNLTRLHLDSVTKPRLSHLAVAGGFPPLQELAVTNAEGIEWVGILRLCSQSLRILEIAFQDLYLTNQVVITIDLPVLKHLTYQTDLSGPPFSCSIFPLSLITPSLETYHESQSHFSTPLHNDTRTVSELWLRRCVSGPNFHSFNISNLKNVRKIYTDFDTSHGLKVILRRLEEDPDLCPHLQSIHSYDTKTGAGSEESRVQSLRPRRNRKDNPAVIYHDSPLPLKRLEFSQIVMKYPPEAAPSQASKGYVPYLGLNMPVSSQWAPFPITPFPITIPTIPPMPPTPVSPLTPTNNANGTGGTGTTFGPLFNQPHPFPFF